MGYPADKSHCKFFALDPNPVTFINNKPLTLSTAVLYSYALR